MNLIKLLSEKRKSENEGFSKSYETSFSQGNSVINRNNGATINVKYNIDSEFFINPQQNIVYMVGNIFDRKVSIPNFEEAEVELKQKIDEIDSQRIFAYSECKDGTAILTGNLGVEALNTFFGGVTLRVPSELFIDGKILRNVEQRDVNRILRNHKNYISCLEIISNPRLAEKLARTYRELNNYLRRV